MVKINPITGEEEKESVKVLGFKEGQVEIPGVNVSPFKNTALESVALEGVVDTPKGIVGPTPIVPKKIKPTVATFNQPIIDKDKIVEEVKPDIVEVDTTEDIRAVKLGEVLSDEEKRTLIDSERDRIRNLDNVTFEEKNKQFQKLKEGISGGEFFGGETQLDTKRKIAAESKSRITDKTKEALDLAEDVFATQLEKDVTRIREQGQKVLETTQRLNSLRGGGRGSVNDAAIAKQQDKIDGLILAAEKKSDLALQKRRLEVQGASSDAIASVDNALLKNEVLLNERIAEATKIQLELNDSIGADFNESMDSSMQVLETAGEDIAGIDKGKSAGLGYFVNQDGSIYLNNAGNPVVFKSIVETGTYTPIEIDNFANGIADGSVKFSDLDLEGRDISRVIGAMNNKLDNKSGLSINPLKAQRILKDLGLPLDEGSIKTVTNLLKVNSEAEVKEMISTDEFRDAAFITGNQKLFDDLRKDATSFKDIDRTFKGMNQIWEDFKDNKPESRAAMEQALIIMFNKMLDPGSVVREGEFDRTSQGQSVIATAQGFLARLKEGGAGITNETFKDIVNIAGVLHNAAIGTVDDLKTSYTGFATDLGADPKFVDRFFDTSFGDALEGDVDFEGSPDDILDGITGSSEETTTATTTDGGTIFTVESSDIDLDGFLDSDFSNPEQTGGTNDLPQTGFTEKVTITRTGTNVAKDTNNPGNITADSIPAGNTKEEYGKSIGATGTYISPNGREYFVFPSIESGTDALKRDVTAKITGNSANIKPTDTLERFQRVYVGSVNPGYLSILRNITGGDNNTQIKDLDADLLVTAIMQAEGFTN